MNSWRSTVRPEPVQTAPAFGWHTLHDALSGPFEVGSLAAMPFTLTYAGANGMRHFHDGCRPRPTHWDRTGSINEETLTLAQIANAAPTELTPSKRHRCAEDFEAWLPAEVRQALLLFCEARTLTRPWRSAAARGQRRGYEVLPEDFSPVHDGSVLELADRCDQAAGAMEAASGAPLTILAAQLRAIATLWHDQLERADAIRAADPHATVLAWQAEHGLVRLYGSPRQVRWAERIRYDLAHDGADDEVWEMLHTELDAAGWIALARWREHTTDWSSGTAPAPDAVTLSP